MAELKTTSTNASVLTYLKSISKEQKKSDSFEILSLMEKATGLEAKMWGASIIGFGQYHFVYESGKEGDWFLVGFAPRSQNIVLYIMDGFKKYNLLLEKLGKFKTGKSCLYINKLSDIDIDVLNNILKGSIEFMKEKYNVKKTN